MDKVFASCLDMNIKVNMDDMVVNSGEGSHRDDLFEVFQVMRKYMIKLSIEGNSWGSWSPTEE